MLQRYAFLCLLLTWLPAAMFAQTITAFAPASGNVGTPLTLSGTNLDLVTAVAINGTAGVILNKTSTALRLLVMPGTTSGLITTTGGTPATSATGFTVTSTTLNAAQQGPKLVGAGALGSARQSYSIALSADGTTLAVSGEGDNGSVGATWVFTRSGTNWSQQGPKLVGTGALGGARQSVSVALSADGTTLAVGGYSDNNNAGATWIFTRSGTNWSQQGPKLVGTGALGGAHQGVSVSLSADGTTLAVGGFTDNNMVGATWVFTRSGTSWSQQGPKLIATGAVGPYGYTYQGQAVALSADGTTLAVGGDDENGSTGATWVFTRSGTSWSQQGPKLVGTGAVGPAFQGAFLSLSADGNTLAEGGPSDNTFTGATWVFTRSGTNWSQQGPKLVGAGALGQAYQGHSVVLSADGNTLAEGGSGDNNNAGATWVFTRNGTVWSQQGSKLVGTGALGQAYQGQSVALSADGTALAVGGVNDNNAVGATWVFSTASSPLAQRAATGPRVGASFFPNPVAEQLTLSTGALGGTLRLLDNMGRSVLAGAYRNGQQLDLSTLAPGLYWLQLDQQAPQPLLKR